VETRSVSLAGTFTNLLDGRALEGEADIGPHDVLLLRPNF
jgi:hypothetical protein